MDHKQISSELESLASALSKMTLRPASIQSDQFFAAALKDASTQLALQSSKLRWWKMTAFTSASIAAFTTLMSVGISLQFSANVPAEPVEKTIQNRVSANELNVIADADHKLRLTPTLYVARRNLALEQGIDAIKGVDSISAIGTAKFLSAQEQLESVMRTIQTGG